MRVVSAFTVMALLSISLVAPASMAAAGQVSTETLPPPPPPIADFIRTAPSPLTPGSLTTEWAPRTATVKVSLVTIQTADRSSADTSAINLSAAKNSIAAASQYWSGMSGGRLSLSLFDTVTGFKTSARSDWSFDDILVTVTRELGWIESPNTSLVVFMPRNDVVVYGQGGNLGAGWSSGPTSGRVLMPYPSAYTNAVMGHEFGHVFGLDHANSLQCKDGSADSTYSQGKLDNGNCYSRHYGNMTSLMGVSQAAMPTLDAYQYDIASLGNGYEIRNIGTPLGTASYTLTPWAGPGNARALKFTDPISKEVYYLELRMPVGYDGATAVNGNRGVQIIKADPAEPTASMIIPPRTIPYDGWYHPNLAWQSGTFTTAAGTRVTLDYINSGAAGITIRAATPYVSYFKHANSANIYGKRADGSFKALSWSEYLALGMPAYTTVPAVSFVKNSWSPTIYAVESNGKGKALSYAAWEAYGLPAPTSFKLLAGTYFYKKPGQSTLFYASPAGETTATLTEWAAAGSPPITVTVRYVKYGWDPTIYKLDGMVDGKAELASSVVAISYQEWSAAGFPTPERTPHIGGSTIFKFNNFPSIFLKAPSGSIHELTLQEWMEIPANLRVFTDKGPARFVKNSWSSAIYMVGSDNKGTQLTYQQWVRYGLPGPQVSTLIPGSGFVRIGTSPALYYDSPSGLVGATNAEYVAAGSPPVTAR